ncbi:MAG: glycerophosphodiester phosphodiesterase [Lachnospiraceae bacterium]|nr:glycerophosphodiester phosphodiesterase [Lachnospiraceae bacterium]
MGKRPDRKPFEGRFYAHRGFHDNTAGAPENSMAAFRRAVRAGYGIELDVQLTRDKVPVVFHDFTLKRMCGKPGRVSDYTFQELRAFRLGRSREKIPTLSEVLELVDGRVPLIVEYKLERMDAEVCRLGDALLAGYKGSYCIESFHPLALLWYRRHRNGVMRGQLSMNYWEKRDYRGKPLYLILQFLLLNFLTGPDFIAFDCRGEKNLSFRLCTGVFGALPVAWTIRSEEERDRAEKRFQWLIFEGFVPEESNGG